MRVAPSNNSPPTAGISDAVKSGTVPMIGQWQVQGVEQVRTLEARRIARLQVPGLPGDLQQDLGRRAASVCIEGSLCAADVRDKFLTSLRDAFHAAAPVSFVADIVEGTRLDAVLIEAFDLREVNDAADAFRYRIVLVEYVQPEQSNQTSDGQGPDIDSEVDQQAQDDLNAAETSGDSGVPGSGTAALRGAA
jgi:hypothetical protein